MILLTVFGKIISIFIIMIFGVICYKTEIIDKYAQEKLSRLTTQVINPLIIFTSFQMEYDTALLEKMGILLALACFSYLLSIMLGHLFLRKKEGYDLEVEKYAITYNNVGFIGIPLCNAVFGSTGVVYATVFIVAFNIFCWTHGILLMDKGGFNLKKVINPCTIAVVVGMICFIFQIRMPESIEFAMESIGDMNTPLAMLVSGAIMAQLNFKESLKKGRLYYISFLRLIVSPVIFCLILKMLPIGDELRMAAAMLAACPSGAMTITMSILYDHDEHYGTEIFTLTTLLSLVTIPFCIWFVGL